MVIVELVPIELAIVSTPVKESSDVTPSLPPVPQPASVVLQIVFTTPFFTILYLLAVVSYQTIPVVALGLPAPPVITKAFRAAAVISRLRETAPVPVLKVPDEPD